MLVLPCLNLPLGQLYHVQISTFRPLGVPGNHRFGVLRISILVGFHEASVIGHYCLVRVLKPVEHALHDTPGNFLHTEPPVGCKQRIVPRKADHVIVEGLVRLNIALEVHKTMIYDQWERRLHTLTQFRQFFRRNTTGGVFSNTDLDRATRIKSFLYRFRINWGDDIAFGKVARDQPIGNEFGQRII